MFSYSHPDRLAGIHCSQSTHSSEELRENLWEGDQEEGTGGVRSQRVTEQSRRDAQDPVGAGSVSPCDSICTRKATRMRYSVTLVISGCRFCLACEDLVCVALLPCGEVGNLFTRHTEESFVQVAPAPDPVLLQREVALCLLEHRGSIKMSLKLREFQVNQVLSRMPWKGEYQINARLCLSKAEHKTQNASAGF